MTVAAGNDLFAAICHTVSERAGLRFNRWARSRFENILPKRLAAGDYRQPSEYYHFLRDDPFSNRELARIISEITSCRPRLLDANLLRVVRQSCQKNAPGILVAGATAVEDAYSVAVALAEANLDPALSGAEITALDFDLDRLIRGTQGIFTSRALAGVEGSLLTTYFDEIEARRFQAKAHLRESIRWLFAPLSEGCNILFRRKWDVIICRRMFSHMNGHAIAGWKRLAALLAPDGTLAADRRLNLHGDVQTEPLGRLWIHRKPSASQTQRNASFRKRYKEGGHRHSAFSSAGCIEDCRRAVIEEPLSGTRRIAFAFSLMRDRQVDEARSQMLSALALAPHSPDVLLACGMLFERIGNRVAAGKYYRKALIVKPTMAAAFLHLAELHKNEAQHAAAKKIYRCMPDIPTSPPGVRFPAVHSRFDSI